MMSLPMKDYSYFRNALALCLITLIHGGCGNSAGIVRHELSMPVLTTSGAFRNARAESGLPQVRLLLGSGRLTAEIASTPPQTFVGLSFRAGLEPDGAMLFTYQTPHKAVFHMKDTWLQLSVAYIDSMGTVMEIHDLKPGDATPVVSGSSAVRFVVEVNRGWFERNGVVPGSRIYVE